MSKVKSLITLSMLTISSSVLVYSTIQYAKAIRCRNLALQKLIEVPISRESNALLISAKNRRKI